MVKPVITVLNPNSNQAMTASFAAELAPLQRPHGPSFSCKTLEDGPFEIASDEDISSAAPLVAKAVSIDTNSSAFIIACYSDPGLEAARKSTSQPVFGIGECAVLTALSLGERFGIISISNWSVSRHKRDMKARGLYARCAGDRPLGLSVTAVEEDPRAYEHILSTGRKLAEVDGADAIITACAGMSKHRQNLQRELGIPVVDPVFAAATLAGGAVL